MQWLWNSVSHAAPWQLASSVRAFAATGLTATKKFAPKKAVTKTSGDGSRKGGPAIVDMKNPKLQQILSMLVPVNLPTPAKLTAEQEMETRLRMNAYNEKKTRLDELWKQDMTVKHMLQQNALKALPDHLQKQATEPDYTPFPPNRKFFFDSPPTAYQE